MMARMTKLYTSKSIRNTDIDVQNGLGWRPFHMTNRGRDFEVIYDNSPPTPTSADELRYGEFLVKINDDTITDREFVEYERLRLSLGKR